MIGENGRIRGLDGLRAVAVIFVFLTHKTAFFNRADLGDSGVTLFFVLSGYLITSILLNARKAIEAGHTTRRTELIEFIKNRAFRIYPAYYAMILTCVALTKFSFHHINLVTYKDIPFYASFTTNWYAASTQVWPPLGHLWSMAVEEQFYLISAPLFLLIPVRHAWRIVLVLLALAAVTFCVETVAGATSMTLGVDSLVNFGTMALGCALALLISRRNRTSSGLILIGFLAMIAVNVAPGLVSIPRPYADLMMQAVGLLAALIVGQTVVNQGSRAVALLEWAPLRRLGGISYGFYLWHLPINFSFAHKAMVAVAGAPIAAALIFVGEFAATVAMAALSWRWIEAPALRARDRLRKSAAQRGALAPLPQPSAPIG